MSVLLNSVAPGLDDCQEPLIHPPAVFAARAALGAMPPAEEVARLFALIADPTRLRLVSALAPGELCVCDLAAATGINRSTVSHQLRTLREGRLVRSRREGRVVFYSLADDHVRALLAMGIAHAGEERTSSCSPGDREGSIAHASEERTEAVGW